MQLRKQNNSLNVSELSIKTFKAGAFGASFGVGIGVCVSLLRSITANVACNADLEDQNELSTKEIVLAFVVGSTIASTLAAYGVTKISNCCSSLFKKGPKKNAEIEEKSQAKLLTKIA